MPNPTLEFIVALDPAPVRITATLHRAWAVPAPATEGVIAESSTSGHFDAAARNDWGGHKFVSDREMLGASNDSWANLWRYRTGAVTAEAYWRVLPPPDPEGYGYKLDSAAPCPNGDGSYELWGTAHQIKSGTRKTCIWFVSVPAAGWVAGPGGQLEADGGPFDNRGLEGAPAPAPTPGEPVDYAQIQRMIDAGFAGLVHQFGGTGVRDGIMQKAKDAQVGNLDPANHDTWAAAYQYALWLFLNNRLWEQMNKVCEARGLGHAPAGLESAPAPYDEAAGRAALDAWRAFAANEDTTATARTGEINTNATESGTTDSGDAQP